jgi:transposase
MPPQDVKPYVKTNKNDYRDAEANAEAVLRPTMRFVPLKSEEQLDLQTLHRWRRRLIVRRTSLINPMRAFLLERGIAVAQGPKTLQRRLPEILADDGNRLSPRMRRLVEEMGKQRHLDKQIAEIDVELATISREDDACRRLGKFPGSVRCSPPPWSRRWTTAPPRQGAGHGRLAWPYAERVHDRWPTAACRDQQARQQVSSHPADPRSTRRSGQPCEAAGCAGTWLARLLSRGHRNVAVVALANKLARIAWAVLSGARRFEPSSATRPQDTAVSHRVVQPCLRFRSCDGTTVYRRSGNLGSAMASIGRPDYEDLGARILIIARSPAAPCKGRIH